MLKPLLLSLWYDPSDVKLADALDDRASFCRFCGFAASERTPERTAFVRFRRELVRHGLDTVLFEAVTRQLDAKNVMAKTGTLVDATVIASASIAKDGEARWVGHRRKAAVHGYKAHVASDADGSIVRRIEMTPANVNDGRMLGAVLPPDPGNVHADLAYASSRNEILIRDVDGTSRLPARSVWGGAEALERLEAWNPRGRPCPPPGREGVRYLEALLRSAAMRWIGLAKAGRQVRLTAIAFNLTRTRNILRERVA